MVAVAIGEEIVRWNDLRSQNASRDVARLHVDSLYCMPTVKPAGKSVMASGLRLRLFRSLWGIDRTHERFWYWPSLLQQLKDLGYEGIEASLTDLGPSTAEREKVATELNDAGMDVIIGVYSSWQDYEDRADHYKPPAKHLHQLADQMLEATRLGACHINCHTGSDSFDDRTCVDFFQRVMEKQTFICGNALVPVSHETHRGRPLGSPFVTDRLLQVIPELKLTADISHWCVSCERLFGQTAEERALLVRAAPRVIHIHARVGTPQSPQIADINDTRTNQEAIDRHVHFWKMVRDVHRDAISVTPEYGPYPYTPGLPYTRMPVSDVLEVTEAAARHVRETLGRGDV